MTEMVSDAPQADRPVQEAQQPESVMATLRYTVDNGEVPVVYVIDYADSTIEFEDRRMPIVNARPTAGSWNTEENGFQLIKMTSELEDPSDQELIDKIYRPHGTKVLQDLTGASKVIMFHTATRDLRKQLSDLNYHAASNVHIDYNHQSYEHHIREYLGEEAEHWLSRRWAAYNIWKPFDTVESMPLAVCDARTVTDEDLILCGMGTRPGEPLWPVSGVNVMFSERHRWYYFPLMTADEALIFKLCDSDRSRPYRTAHTAFADPSGPANPRPRVSMEARCIAFF